MSAYEATEAREIQRMTLRRVGATLGFASVRFGAVNLHSLRVEERPDGRLTFTPPETVGRDGTRWPAYALQPGVRELVEAELGCLWARSA